MFSEITSIQNFIDNNQVEIYLNVVEVIDDKLIPVKLKIFNKIFMVHVQDEFSDFGYNNPLLNFVVVFKELLLINDAEDFLVWCKYLGLNANNYKLLDYYKKISNDINIINKFFPENKIDCFVSDLSFQLNSGVMFFLRNKN